MITLNVNNHIKSTNYTDYKFINDPIDEFRIIRCTDTYNKMGCNWKNNGCCYIGPYSTTYCLFKFINAKSAIKLYNEGVLI